LELLAFTEGRLLSIHPFTDFNGRAARLFLRLLLRRLDLPAIDLVPGGQESSAYLAALAAGDHANWTPLITIWRQRFEKEA
jgi:CRISPR-associated endonuclease/helicase Cas3